MSEKEKKHVGFDRDSKDSDDAPLGLKKGTDNRRCGFVAVIGAPNAGKSTLVNALVGAKVSIVSHKVQTTRVPLRGIAIFGVSQLVFIDTPGIFTPKRQLDKAMVDAAWGGSGEADITALLVDAAKGLDEDVERIVSKLEVSRGKTVLVLNKIDRVRDKNELLLLASSLSKRVSFDRVFMISALKSDGLSQIKDYLSSTVPKGPWHYPEDEISDMPMRVVAAEITREKIYKWLHNELPYAITVETSAWKKLRKRAVRIEQTIFVERDSQKSIVLGKGGSMIKQISSQAREEMAAIMGRPVHLFLFVKVREGWQRDPERYREMGLEFPKK